MTRNFAFAGLLARIGACRGIPNFSTKGIRPLSLDLGAVIGSAGFEAAKLAAIEEEWTQKLKVETFLEAAGVVGSRSGKAPLLLDVRAPCEFLKGHIPGAISLPLFNDAERAEVSKLHLQAIARVLPSACQVVIQALHEVIHNHPCLRVKSLRHFVAYRATLGTCPSCPCSCASSRANLVSHCMCKARAHRLVRSIERKATTSLSIAV